MRARFGDWTLDSEARELRCRGEAVHIAPKTFHLLELLIEYRQKALSRKELADLLWPSTFVSESSLATLVKELRVVLGDSARGSRFVRTVFGHGYAFAIEAEVEDTGAVIDSIAVLPFENAGSGAEENYLSDGIAEELVNALCLIPRLRVAPCSSSFRYRTRAEIRTVARELRVRALVTGRVYRHDENLTVHVELVDATSDARLWGNRFPTPRTRRAAHPVRHRHRDLCASRREADNRWRKTDRHCRSGEYHGLGPLSARATPLESP
jgi:DNA-binding winged helix-turn-helix (wHTH) protein